MATAIWSGNLDTGLQTGIAQVQTIVITAASSATTAVWTITVTGQDGSTQTAAYTEDGSPTVAEIVTGLTAAWNDANHPFFTRVTAAESSSTTITFTADAAGEPFTLSLADSSNGTHSDTMTTANLGKTDYNTAENWSTNAVPTASDDVIIPAGAGLILWGLDQSGVSVNKFRVENGYTGQIGGTDDGYLQLLLDASSEVYIAGSGRKWIDIAASNVDPVIEESASIATGQFGLYLKATAMTDLYIRKGNVAFGIDPDDTTSECDVFHVSYVSSPSSDANLTIGAGVTDLAGSGDPDVTMVGGVVVSNADVDVLTMEVGSNTYTQAKGKWTTAHIRGGTAYPDRESGNSTFATTNMSGGGKLNNTRTLTTKTFTNVNIYTNDVEIKDPNGNITWSNAWDAPNIKTDKCVFDFGANKKIAITNS